MKNGKGVEKINPHRKGIYQLADGVTTKPSGLGHFNKRIANFNSLFVLLICQSPAVLRGFFLLDWDHFFNF